MSEIYLVNDFDGVQKGTKDNPYSVKTALEYDTLLASLLFDENDWHKRDQYLFYGGGEFLTGCCYEWGPFAAATRPRLGPGWQIHGTGDTIISLDPNAIPDEQVNDWPLHVLCSASPWQQYLWWPGKEQAWIDLSPEDLWKQLSVGQLVKDVTINLNYSKLIDRWRAKGKALKLSGGVLQGHGAAFEGVKVTDFGAYHVIDAEGKIVGAGAEAFPLIIAGAVDGFDRNKIAKLSNTDYVFDSQLEDKACSHITDCSYSGYVDADSNDQVTCNMITTSIGQPALPAMSAGDDTSPYVHHYRKFAYHQRNKVNLPNADATKNQVQAFTLYQTLRGDISFNEVLNIQTGTYSDFYHAQGVDVHDNKFLRVMRGAAWLLSPVGPDAEHFTSSGHKARRNKITLVPTDVPWHGGVLAWRFEGAAPPRYVGQITVGGKGEENDISVDGPMGSANVAVRAVGADQLTIGANILDSRFGSHEYSITDCTRLVIPAKPGFWRRLFNWFKTLL